MAIITCFHLPGMNGYALVREARNQWPQQKAIIISGSMMKQDYVEIKQSICRYLAKPFAAVELYKLLQALSHCHSHCAANKHFRFEERCRFGLNHACPFYSAGQTASQAAVSSEPA
jgi:CheY-like chemotaxis protein